MTLLSETKNSNRQSKQTSDEQLIALNPKLSANYPISETSCLCSTCRDNCSNDSFRLVSGAYKKYLLFNRAEEKTGLWFCGGKPHEIVGGMFNVLMLCDVSQTEYFLFALKSQGLLNGFLDLPFDYSRLFYFSTFAGCFS